MPCIKHSPFGEFRDNVYFYAAEVGGDTIGTAFVVLGMKIIERLIGFLWINEPMLFAGAPFAFPLAWLFNLADVVLIIGFLTLAGFSLLRRMSQSFEQKCPKSPPASAPTVTQGDQLKLNKCPKDEKK